MKARTIDKVYEGIKTGDPDTAITKSAIRQAVINGDIKSRKVGVKYIVTEEAVLKYFGGEY